MPSSCRGPGTGPSIIVACPFPQEELIESPKMTSFNEVVTTFLLIRHGSTDLVGKALAGRMPGVSLDANGRNQAQQLANRLDETVESPLSIAVLWSGRYEQRSRWRSISGIPVLIQKRSDGNRFWRLARQDIR